MNIPRRRVFFPKNYSNHNSPPSSSSLYIWNQAPSYQYMYQVTRPLVPNIWGTGRWGSGRATGRVSLIRNGPKNPQVSKPCRCSPWILRDIVFELQPVERFDDSLQKNRQQNPSNENVGLRFFSNKQQCCLECMMLEMPGFTDMCCIWEMHLLRSFFSWLWSPKSSAMSKVASEDSNENHCFCLRLFVGWLEGTWELSPKVYVWWYLPGKMGIFMGELLVSGYPGIP